MARPLFRLESPDYGNQVNRPHAPNTPHRRLTVSSSRQAPENPAQRAEVLPPSAKRFGRDDQSVAVLLDLSGDKKAAIDWAATQLLETNIKSIDKADLKWTSKREALARVRSLRPEVFSVFSSDMNNQSGLGALMLFAICAGARRIVIGDRRNRSVSRSRLGVLLLEVPRFALECLVGYGIFLPLSWLLTEVLRISLAFRGAVRASRSTKKRIDADRNQSLTALYIRATLTSAAEGGMPTHVAGFASGARALGHRLRFLVSGAQCEDDGISIEPSRLFSATKTLFELWNNLVFTLQALRMLPRLAAQPNDFDFIYQRYSRFNWTGVALSVLTGFPLGLEYNGSEVWVARQWDPIGQLWLLKRFERLNQHAADLILVVSEVERGNLIDAGVRPEKIVVNPNGVDPNRFRPGCGGREIRRVLGVDDRTVVGFVGTFGPWHGAPVLAEAARVLATKAGFHFLFIGDGDQRAQTESIVESALVSATFAGRISHDSVPAYLDACDILVSPHVPSADGSEFFGSPTKLFEYMAMGKGLVASRLGQIAEVIGDGENGLIVEPGDAVALARAIEKLAQDDALCARLGAAARQTVIERYTWKDNAARVFDAMRTRSDI
jgi:glycosyltransferase involved in cell wall biosynthesis